MSIGMEHIFLHFSTRSAQKRPRRKVVGVIRETVIDGEPALAVDTEEEFARALGSGVYVVPPFVGGRDGLAPLGRGQHEFP